ncbi:hypothetical protein HYR99_05435 [Candidatus Poribacteria bacterium]|nr:hypothetical protein [Candidatus Poribacteria bacterium]
MGDIYCLLGTGVRIIVLIDGIFHSKASVWQRELLEALDNDIMVVGASSMGALRAAELYPFGMIGHGTIFEWYRDGVIDGDDEVALMHGDESNGFRSLSEPLVNIRHTLMQAVRQKYISQEQAADLIEYAKSTYYAERSYDSLLNSPVVKSWPQKVRERLAQFINRKSVNLKKQDALRALRYCAMMAKRENRPVGANTRCAPTALPLSPPSRYYRWVSYLKRGFLHPSGSLVSGEDVLAEARKDVDLIKGLQPALAKHFSLLLWVKERNINCPADYLDHYKQKWKEDHITSDYRQWLRSNGLTEREFQSELNERALLKWIVEQEPHHFGLDFTPYVQLVKAWLSLNPSDEAQCVALLSGAKEICYLATWAKRTGARRSKDDFRDCAEVNDEERRRPLPIGVWFEG